MSRTLYLAMAASLAFSAAAWADGPSREQLQAELQSLQARAAALQARQANAVKEVDATIDAVMRDADAHSQLLAVSPVGAAGYDNGFYLQQGAFTLKPGAHLQFRNVTDIRKEGKNGSTDITNGFEFRRARLELGGSAWDMDFYIQFETARSGGGVTLLDAYMTYPVGSDFYVKGGQFKVWAFHEEDVSDKVQLAVEKSLLNSFLGGTVSGRIQGVSLVYGNYAKDNDPVYAELTLHDGDSSLNTPFTDASSYWGAAARIEFKLTGNWAAYKDFSARSAKTDLFVLGAGADVSQGNDVTSYLGTVDLQYKSPSGFAVYGAVLGQYLDPRNQVDDDSTFNWGALVQLSYFFNRQWEVFGRYDLTHFENELANGKKNIHEITAGVSYFMGKDGSAGHRSKFTVDVGWLPNGSPAVTGAGVQGGTSKTEVYIRAQLNFVI